MTRKMFAMAAFAALAAATPATAQWNGNVVDTQSLRAEIDAGVARGDLSTQDAASLRSQLRGLADLQRRYAQDGLSYSEREDIQQRAQGLRNEIANAQGYSSSSDYGPYGNGSSNSQRYGNGYGGGYSGGSQGAYGNRYGGSGYGTYGNSAYGNGGHSNGAYGNGGYSNGAYGNGSYNRAYGNRGDSTYGNGAYTNRSYGNGAYANRYGNDQYDRDEDSSVDGYRGDGRSNRDGSYGRDDNDDEGGYALRVGDRADGDLSAVPNAYRTRFRDGGGVYYRYGDGSVYQIDARTGLVLRIYPIDR